MLAAEGARKGGMKERGRCCVDKPESGDGGGKRKRRRGKKLTRTSSISALALLLEGRLLRIQLSSLCRALRTLKFNMKKCQKHWLDWLEQDALSGISAMSVGSVMDSLGLAFFLSSSLHSLPGHCLHSDLLMAL